MFGNCPARDTGGIYGLSVSVKSLSEPSVSITRRAFLLPEYVLVPPKEKYAPGLFEFEGKLYRVRIAMQQKPVVQKVFMLP